MSFSQGSAMSLSDSPELRLILIGEKEAGKSAAGNAILGKKAFDAVGMRTRASLQNQAVVRGQLLTLVDTPGWEWFSLRGTPASSSAVRREMVAGSAELCQPGAHGLLLVVPLAYSFGERERQAAEEHVEMFGQRAWCHTLVLFTIFDRRRLRDSSLEEEVEDNDELQALVDKCGGRYHAMYGKPRRGEDLVGELLGKIQGMVEGKRWSTAPQSGDPAGGQEDGRGGGAEGRGGEDGEREGAEEDEGVTEAARGGGRC
ncbi:GTPase IMAP family member 8 [Clupea harengus]|uniref:GTPase IMAP family member 8 n=1 Tax=Clupea harengus TaxID=7950 RepID=A0A6P8EJM0_CLUHA|nr:GTPase IMAP family member 8 [Clupea harengus]